MTVNDLLDFVIITVLAVGPERIPVFFHIWREHVNELVAFVTQCRFNVNAVFGHIGSKFNVLNAHIAQQVTEAQQADDELYEQAMAVGTLLGEVAVDNAMAMAEEDVY